MGGMLTYPVNTIHTTKQCTSEYNWCHASMQGYRPTMEDNFCVNTNIYDNVSEPVALFAIFDGHGGSKVSKYLSKNITSHIVERITVDNLFDESYKYHLEVIMEELDLKIINDSDIRENGSTAVIAITKQTKWGKKAIVINIGDSRVILLRENKIIFETIDHKPDNTEEYNRIVKAGGFIRENRVDGSLALSRAYGDNKYKTNEKLPAHLQKVVATPTIKYLDISSDDYLLIYCDGLVEKMNNKELAKYFQDYVTECKDDKNVACKLLEHSLNEDSHDNMSIICVHFQTSMTSSLEEKECVLKSQDDDIDQQSINAFVQDLKNHNITFEQFQKLADKAYMNDNCKFVKGVKEKYEIKEYDKNKDKFSNEDDDFR
jgi:serine/threonine protein phosphatase PrpC